MSDKKVGWFRMSIEANQIAQQTVWNALTTLGIPHDVELKTTYSKTEAGELRIRTYFGMQFVCEVTIDPRLWEEATVQ